jgi:hypothetical protein
MSVTQTLMAAGSWSLRFKPNTPSRILAALDWSYKTSAGLGHIFIYGAPHYNIMQSNSDLINSARYCGVVLRWDDEFQISGAGPAWWLGDGDTRGPVFETFTSQSAASLSTWITAIKPAALNSGTVTSPGGTLSASFQWVTRRTALETVCNSFGVEWEVDSRLRLNVGTPANLFRSGKAVAVRNGTSRNSSIAAASPPLSVPATLGSTVMNRSQDLSEYISKAWVLGQNGTGSSSITSPYKDINGNTVVITEVVEGSTYPGGSESAAAVAHVTPRAKNRRYVTLSTNSFDVIGDVRPGDDIYVYDPQLGLYDSANEAVVDGRVINPLLVRCLSVSWPISKGYGVLFRDGDGVWTDLTEFIEYEEGDTTFEIGGVVKTTGNPTGLVGPTADTQEATVPAFGETFTPVLRFGGVAATKGDGFWLGRYYVDGSWIDVELSLSWGATSLSNGGTGIMTIDFPTNYTPVAGLAVNTFTPVGTAMMLNSGVARCARLAQRNSDNSGRISFCDDAFGANYVTHSSPFSFFAPSNGITAVLRYRWK